jgi:phage recombination protein Bet
MSKELTTTNGKEMTKEQIDLVKRTVAKGAGDDEFAMFIYLANKYELDPFLKEICFIKRRVWNPYKNGFDEVPSIMTTRDGFLAIAHRTGQFGGIESDVIYDGNGVLDGAICKVWNKSFPNPVIVKVKFKEYCAYNKEGKPQALWSSKPETMIKKVAESQALRKAFNIKGLYSEEEMEAEIKKDAKTELEFMGDAIKTTEALNDPATYDKWVEDIKVKIMDEIAACQNTLAVANLQRKYKEDIGRLMDEDRQFIIEEFDHKIEMIVRGENAPESPLKEGIEPEVEITDDGEIVDLKANVGEKRALKKTPEAELAEKEAFSKEFTQRAVREIDVFKTRAELTVWKNKNTDNLLKSLKEYSEYVKAYFKTKWEKVK